MQKRPMSRQARYYQRNKHKINAARKKENEKWVFKGNKKKYEEAVDLLKREVAATKFFTSNETPKHLRVYEPEKALADYWWSMSKYNFDPLADAVALLLMLSSCDYQLKPEHGFQSRDFETHCYRYGGIWTIKNIRDYIKKRFGKESDIDSIYNGHIDAIASAIGLKKQGFCLTSMGKLMMWVYRPPRREMPPTERKKHPCPFYTSRYLYEGPHTIDPRFLKHRQGVPLKIMADWSMKFLNFCRVEWEKPWINEDILARAYELVEGDLHRKDEAIKDAKPLSIFDGL